MKSWERQRDLVLKDREKIQNLRSETLALIHGERRKEKDERWSHSDRISREGFVAFGMKDWENGLVYSLIVESITN